MPILGCGIDELCWEKVLRLLNEVFAASKVDIRVCVLKPEQRVMATCNMKGDA